MSSAVTSTFHVFLIIAAFLCTVVFGMVLIFAIVTMPGIAILDDGEFLCAFQVIDGVIQRNQPVFVGVWIGSILSLLVTAGFGVKEIENNSQLALLIVATVAYMAAQVTTFTINVPLNNRLQTLNIACLDDESKKRERDHFERPWNKWNSFRAVIFGFVSLYLVVLLLLTDSGLCS